MQWGSLLISCINSWFPESLVISCITQPITTSARQWRGFPICTKLRSAGRLGWRSFGTLRALPWSLRLSSIRRGEHAQVDLHQLWPSTVSSRPPCLSTPDTPATAKIHTNTSDCEDSAHQCRETDWFIGLRWSYSRHSEVVNSQKEGKCLSSSWSCQSSVVSLTMLQQLCSFRSAGRGDLRGVVFSSNLLDLVAPSGLQSSARSVQLLLQS